MKKLLTLVLALVMVFAIAAPALAITGDVTAPETGAGAPVQVDVQLITAPASSTGFGGFSLTPVAAAKLYVVNEIAFYAVGVRFVEGTTSMLTKNYDGAVLTIACDAFTLTAPAAPTSFDKLGNAIVAPVVPWAPTWTPNATNSKLVSSTLAATDTNYGTGNTYYFFGQGTVAKKGVLSASFAKPVAAPLEITSGTKTLYTVAELAAPATGFTVTTADNDVVTFATDANEEVTGIFVTLAGSLVAGAQEVQFRKLVSGGGSIVQAVGLYAEPELAEAKALYAAVMTFFGFNYDAEGILELRHFASKASLMNIKDEVAVTLYTGSLVIPGGADVPKTGDAASIMGFVMITLAMVAAGFVVSRKVRA